MIGGAGLRGSALPRSYMAGQDYLRSPFVLTRASSATVIGGDGLTTFEVGTNVSRFNGAMRRLLIEGQRTNAVTNPRAEGASGSTAPTGWIVVLPAGLSGVYTRETRQGVEGVKLAITGTTSASGGLYIFFGVLTGVTTGSTTSASYWGQVDADSAAITALNISIAEYQNTTYVGGGTVNWYATRTQFDRRVNNRTLTAATTNRAQIEFTSNSIASGTAVTFTFWLGGVQLEAGAFASSIILPPAGTPGASTRGADVVSATLASLGIGANGACTVLFSGTLASVGGGNRRIATIHDGTFNNAATLLVGGSGNTVAARTTAGAFANGSSVGTPVSDTPFRAGLALDGAGRAAACFNGGTVQAVTGAPTSGLTTLQLGSWLGAEPLFGETGSFRVLPYTLSDSDLQAAVAALPMGQARDVVSPAVLASPLTLTRSQPSSAQSSAVASDNTTISLYGADVARFNGAARRLLLEGQRTNHVSDVRTIGSTGWTLTGVTRAAIAGPTGSGTDGARLTESTLTEQHFTFATSVTTVALSTNYTLSALVRPGTCTACQLTPSLSLFGATSFANFDLTGAGALGTLGAGVSRAAIVKQGDWYRIEMTTTPTSAGTGSPHAVVLIDSLTAARTPSYLGTSRTLDVAWVQMEVGNFASSSILPPVGTPGASTRGADLVTATLASLGIGGNGACTVLWSGMIPQAAPAGVNQIIARLDDGTFNNAFTLRNTAGGSSIEAVRVNAGAGSSATVGTMSVATPFRAGMTIDGAGRIASSLNGATAVAVTGGPTGGLLTFSLGQGLGGSNMFGETAACRVLPYVLSDADLASAVAGLPVPIPTTLVGSGALTSPLVLTRASSGTYIDASGTLVSASTNVARFAGTSRRLMIEGQRTNSLVRSEALDNTVAWAQVNATVAANTTTAPDGQQTGDTIIEDSVSGGHGINQTISANSTLVYTASVYVKAAARSWLRLQVSDVGPNQLRAWFDLSTGVVGSVSNVGTATGAAATISNVGNGWYRCTLSGIPASANSSSVAMFIRAETADGGLGYTGTNGASALVAWGAQLEQATFASSYIATGAAAATRSADLVSTSLTNLAVGSSGACTVLWSGVLPQAAPASIAQVVFRIDDGTTSNLVSVTNLAGGSDIRLERSNAAASANASAGTMVAGNAFRIGVAIDGAGRVAASFNGAAVAAVTGAPTSGLTTLRLGNSSTGNPALFGETQTFRVLPFAVSDAELRNLVGSLT